MRRTWKYAPTLTLLGLLLLNMHAAKLRKKLVTGVDSEPDHIVLDQYISSWHGGRV